MIVKNAAGTLAACLQSARAVVDEMVVVDTGSTDNTLEIAKSHGAVVASVPWRNSFSEARNAALALNRTDWVLALDADEELDEGARFTLPAMLARSEVGAYSLVLRNYLLSRHGRIGNSHAKPNDSCHERAKHAGSYADFLGVRLFRRLPEIFYTGCVHERLTPQIAKSGLALMPSGVCIHHFGFLLMGSEDFAKKVQMYHQLVRVKVEQEPENCFAWFDLGAHLLEYTNQGEEALRCFDRALELEPRLVAAWMQKGLVNLKLQRDEQALAAFEHAAGDKESEVERSHRQGDALHNLGRLEEARRAYSFCLERIGRYPEVASKLGYTEVRLGDVQKGISRILDAVEICSHSADIRDRLVKALIIAEMFPEAADAAEEFATAIPEPRRFLRAAAIRRHLQQYDRTESILEKGVGVFPDSVELRSAQAELRDHAHL